MAAWIPAAAASLLRGIRGLPLLHCVQRMFASQTEGELKVTQILKENFPQATAIKVTDISVTFISGGCGAMYEIQIESEEFKEKRTVQQHQMVNQIARSSSLWRDPYEELRPLTNSQKGTEASAKTRAVELLRTRQFASSPPPTTRLEELPQRP
ncbi:bolA-like protein 3 isoform X1 [Pteropus medius]|uniref:bolA-like protein 3 isoform X1 n=1 Tax=Pteropus vampyrus TaxID=132908 RepID=UPI00196B6386|nr:bolA-like protein 3 isoform X1 [Pteropus giganteus]